MSQYRVGTVTIVDGETTVTGVGTSWLAYIKTGYLFKASSEDTIYIVDSITSDTVLELTTAYSGNQSAVNYIIVTNITANFKCPVINRGDHYWPIFVEKAFTVFDSVLYEPDVSVSATSSSFAYNRGRLSFSSKLPRSGDTGKVVGLESTDDIPSRLLLSGLLMYEIGANYSVQELKYYTDQWNTFKTLDPVITDISPDEDLTPAQTEIIITGTYFGNHQGSSTITINGTDAGSASVWEDTSIVVRVPVEATSGNVIVTIRSNASNSYPVTIA